MRNYGRPLAKRYAIQVEIASRVRKADDERKRLGIDLSNWFNSVVEEGW